MNAEATDLHVRDMIAGEDDALGRVMFRAIHEGPSAYSDAQREAWCAIPPQGADWAVRLEPLLVRVAEANGAPVGFMARKAAYIDFTFVLPDWQGRGVFSVLYARVEAEARAEGLHRLWVHASLMAPTCICGAGIWCYPA